MAFCLTEKQKQARAILNGPAKFILLYGGSRSGKTFVEVRNIIIRTMGEAKSRHGIFRQTRKDLKESIWLDTYPKVLDLCAAGINPKNNESELYSVFNNKSEIWFGFLDDKKHSDNVLGKEYNTIFFNEVSEISYKMFSKALTRLALKNGLRNKVYCDCNPPGTWHWAYKLFIEKINPETDEPLANPEDYAVLNMNPIDNLANLPEDYIKTLEGLPEEERNRFLLGIWQEGVSGGIYTKEIALAEQEGRICEVAHNPEFPVYPIFDIGIGDETSIIFAQFAGQRINLIDFYEASNEGSDHYVSVMRQREKDCGYKYANIFFPHDGRNREWITGTNRRQAIESKGFRVSVLPASPVEDGINAVKMLFGQIWFDKARCKGLLEALRNYHYEQDPIKLIRSKTPAHDWSSHASDALRYTAMAYNSKIARPLPKEQAPLNPAAAIKFSDLLVRNKRRRYAE
ncbi:MAG: phage terminase large subunit [Elusimicrobiota bacterium]|jgi:PBSX family phage terminase large subunit|nr:phage terminase large subunit [Elusimicrobiota bacterium]